MADKQFTLLQMHFHDDIQLGPRSLSGGDESADDAATESTSTDTEESTDESGSGAGIFGSLLGLGALAALAYGAKKLLDGVEPEGLDALDDIEEQVESVTEEAEDEESVPIEVTSPDEASGSRVGLVVAAVAVLLALALAARKLLAGSEEIVVEE